jgi:hypothetical protein
MIVLSVVVCISSGSMNVISCMLCCVSTGIFICMT